MKMKMNKQVGIALQAPRCPFVLYVGKKKLVKRREFERFLSENIQI